MCITLLHAVDRIAYHIGDITPLILNKGILWKPLTFFFRPSGTSSLTIRYTQHLTLDWLTWPLCVLCWHTLAAGEIQYLWWTLNARAALLHLTRGFLPPCVLTAQGVHSTHAGTTYRWPIVIIWRSIVRNHRELIFMTWWIKDLQLHGQRVYSGAAGWVFTQKKKEEVIQERIMEKPKLYTSR